MASLDDIDRTILRLLVEDARRPFSEIAEQVDRSPPTVADRVERLQDLGLITRFTVALDRSRLSDGLPMLVDLAVKPGATERVRTGVLDLDGVEHIFTTAEGHVVFQGHLGDRNVESLLSGVVSLEDIHSYDVDLLSDVSWQPAVGEAAFAPECAECGNTVTAEGTSVVLDDDRYHFCCSSCEVRFTETYEELKQGA
ncbi:MULTISPECIES: AsnC family transcriptional regulator [unclassified Haladaptatus]|uniref:AsnC family transcriptional regulator n=1 Tax=unclassified Haladaptatus TaxID=2622732 RepID=UPI0023E7E88A|nr:MULTISPECIES: AsnC family transcriptional regulator [unclassified Haladaptatus]